jgi:hypothetical protein
MAYGEGDRGVGGWLAFFLVTLGIIGPIFFIVTGYIALSDPSMPLAYGDVWPSLLTAEIILMMTVVAISWFAAWRLLKVFNWTSVRIAIASLWALAFLTVFGEALIVSTISGLELGMLLDVSAGPELVRPFIYATVWTLYLLLSKRVRNTYSGLADEKGVTEVFQ